METLSGKSAVVTGAASGIGLALAERLAWEGCRLLLADIQADSLEAAREKLAEAGAEVSTVVVDVSSADSVANLAAVAKDTFGDIHLVCNNAGVINAASLWDSTLAEYEWVMGVNLWGIIHSVREFVPLLKAQDCQSHILNTVSMGSLVALPYSGIYYMTKAAAMSLSETLYLELSLEAPHVGVTALCPEFVRTQLATADRNAPAGLAMAHSDMRSTVLATLAQSTSSDEATSPDVLAERAVQAVMAGRFYATAEDDNPWTISMRERFKAISERGTPPFIVPTRDGTAGLV